jgi:hypothetical protein
VRPALLLLVAAALSESSGEPRVDPWVEEFLTAPFRGDPTPRGFRIVALAHLAEYCASLHVERPSPQTRACTAQLVRLAHDPRVSPYEGELPARLGEHGLYLTHLNIVLGAYEIVHRDGRHARDNRRVSEHLAQLLLRSPQRHAPSYPNTRARWPADQAALLYSLFIYDQSFGGSLAAEPIDAWRAVMTLPRNLAASKLPVSDVAGATATAAEPRGCALSFTARYMSAFAPAEAHALWTRYVDLYGVAVGPALGLREWPPGYDGPMDVDSGPIVFGVGAAATGLGLLASRTLGDELTYARLASTRALIETTPLAAAGTPAIARSIALLAEHYRPWFSASPRPHPL